MKSALTGRQVPVISMMIALRTPIFVPEASPVEVVLSAPPSVVRTMTALPVKPALAHAQPTTVYRDNADSLSVLVDPWHPIIQPPMCMAA